MSNIEIPINVVTPNNVASPINNNNDNLADDGDSGGLSRWLIWSIIGTVVVLIGVGAYFLVKWLLNKSRENNTIVTDVADTISTDVEQKSADKLVDVALRAATDSAQLEANTQTATSLYATGDATQQDVQKAVVASEISKAVTAQKSLDAARALEDLRKKQLANADAEVFVATQQSAAASSAYENVSNQITSQKLQEAQAALRDVIAKRQAADDEYNKAVALRAQAEANAQQRLDTSVNQKRSIIESANAKMREIVAKVNAAKKEFAQYAKQNTSDSKAPKQPDPTPAPSPAPSPSPEPSPSPGPSPPPSSGGVMLMSSTKTVNLDGSTIAGGRKAWSQSWKVPSQFQNAVKLSFDINFAPGFSFDDGPTDARGKVGGIFIGSGAASGCSHSDTAASLRLMWEHQRTAQAYSYFPVSTKGKQPAFINAMGDPSCGLGVWKKEFNGIFQNTGSWYNVVLGVKLNDVGQNNGKMYMSITGPKNLMKESDGIIWRTRSGMNVNSVDFVSFFGGDQNMTKVKPSSFQIKNIQLFPY